jgi:hypothetical protein
MKPTFTFVRVAPDCFMLATDMWRFTCEYDPHKGDNQLSVSVNRKGDGKSMTRFSAEARDYCDAVRIAIESIESCEFYPL